MLAQVESYNYDKCVVEWVPMKYPYFRSGIKLEQPKWDMVRISGGKEEAVKHAPCIFMEFIEEGQAFRAKIYVFGPETEPPDGQ